MQALALRTIGILLMLLALAVTLAHAPDRSVESLVARWAQPPSDFMVVKGQLVHYRDEGPREDATPLVLVHGTSASLHTWEGWATELAQTHRWLPVPIAGERRPHNTACCARADPAKLQV